MHVMMPGKNGLDTIRSMEKAGMPEGLQEIVIDYITKPVDPVDLPSSVCKYLDCLALARVGN